MLDYTQIFQTALTDSPVILTETQQAELVDFELLNESGVQKQTAVTSVLIDTRSQMDIKVLVDIFNTAMKPFDIKVLLQPVQKNTRYQILLFARKNQSI